MSLARTIALKNRHYLFIFELCPGDSFAVGSMYTFALLIAVGASPKPTAISFSLLGMW